MLIFALTPISASAEIWALDCQSGLGRITLTDAQHAVMAVSSNQIIVSSKVDVDADSITFFYSEPEDLGRGGMMLSWKSFSKDKAMATGKILEDGRLLFTWNGFFDQNTESFIWANDSDYVLESGGKTTKLESCAAGTE